MVEARAAATVAAPKEVVMAARAAAPVAAPKAVVMVAGSAAAVPPGKQRRPWENMQQVLLWSGRGLLVLRTLEREQL